MKEALHSIVYVCYSFVLLKVYSRYNPSNRPHFYPNSNIRTEVNRGLRNMNLWWTPYAIQIMTYTLEEPYAQAKNTQAKEK